MDALCYGTEKVCEGMTMLKSKVLAGVALAAALAGCGDKKKEGGQTVAQIDGKDVTIHEVNQELEGARIPPGMDRKVVEKIALERVIDRKLVARAAADKGVDKDPRFLLAKRRADELMLAQYYQQQLAGKVAPVLREDIDKFIAANPNMFDQRKFYVLDQLQFLQPPNLQQLGLDNLKTLGEIETALNRAGIEFRRAPTSMDALQSPPALIAQIANLQASKPGEVFVFADQPQGAPRPVIFANTITQARVMPFTGEPARAFARQVLENQKRQKTVGTQLTALIKDKSKVTYSTGWGPPAKPGTPAAGAKAPAAATAAARTPAPAPATAAAK